MKDLEMGLDAMERVLKRAKYEGMRHFGHSCESLEHKKYYKSNKNLMILLQTGRVWSSRMAYRYMAEN